MNILERTLQKVKDARVTEAPHWLKEPASQQPSAAADSKLRGVSVLGPDEPPPTRVVRMDRQSMFAAGMVPAESDRALSAEQYRVIKQDLIDYCAVAAPAGFSPRKFVMVTSAQPGDGKTFTAVNLALSMTSERDHDVLLVDGDVARPHLTRSLGLADAPGLLDALRERKRRFSSVIYATDGPRLHVLPAGTWSEDATELLSSGRMRRFMHEIHLRYPQRLVVLDSSPAMLMSDARVLAGMVGQIVLVVKAGSTRQHDVKEAAALLNNPRRRVALVLNQMRSNKLLDSVTGYRYGYGYSGPRSADINDSAPTR
jgi:protein-tyrosine kinase